MSTLHDDEADTGLDVVIDLLRRQAPGLARLPLAPMSSAGPSTGTDNVLYRLGPDLVVRCREPPPLQRVCTPNSGCFPT